MLEFKSLETSHLILFNGKQYSITEAEVDMLCWYTANLIDENHEGSAVVTLGTKTVVMPQTDWEQLYDSLEGYLQNYFEMEEILEERGHSTVH